MGFEDVKHENGQQRRIKQAKIGIIPNPPEGLTGDSLKEFRRLIPILGEDIHKTDINLVAGYCVEICRYWECQEILKRDGMTLVTHSGYSQQRPEVTISRQSLQNAISLAAQIGLSAKARKQLDLELPATPKDPADGSEFADRWSKI